MSYFCPVPNSSLFLLYLSPFCFTCSFSDLACINLLVYFMLPCLFFYTSLCLFYIPCVFFTQNLFQKRNNPCFFFTLSPSALIYLFDFFYLVLFGLRFKNVRILRFNIVLFHFSPLRRMPLLPFRRENAPGPVMVP